MTPAMARPVAAPRVPQTLAPPMQRMNRNGTITTASLRFSLAARMARRPEVAAAAPVVVASANPAKGTMTRAARQLEPKMALMVCTGTP